MEIISKVLFINLDHRQDRCSQVINELNQLFPADIVERFPATKMANGAIGCTISHIKALKYAIENNLPNVLIVEDDIQFTNVATFTNQFNTFLTSAEWENADVVLIAGNNIPPHTVIAPYCVKVGSCQTTTGYLVKQHYYETLYANFSEGLRQLLKAPHEHAKYAIDKYWFNLQRVDNWFLITPLTVTQRDNWSDIEKRNTNYTNMMLDLDKTAFMRRISRYVNNV